MEEDLKFIQDGIVEMARTKGYDTSGFLSNVAKAKLRMFGRDSWQKCPCDQSGERFCISEKCGRDIEADGRCHCNLYIRKQQGEPK